MEINEDVLKEFIEQSNGIFELAALFNRDSDQVWLDAKTAYLESNKKLLLEVFRSISVN